MVQGHNRSNSGKVEEKEMSGGRRMDEIDIEKMIPASIVTEIIEIIEKEVLYGKSEGREPRGIIKPAWCDAGEYRMEEIHTEKDAVEVGIMVAGMAGMITADAMQDMIKEYEMSIEAETGIEVWEKLEKLFAEGRKLNRAERRNNGKRDENKSGSKFKGRRDEKYESPLYRGIPKRGRSSSKAVRSRTRNRS